MTGATINTLEDAWALRNTDRATARSVSENLLNRGDTEPYPAALVKIVLGYLDYRERRYERATTACLDALGVLEANPRDRWLPRLYNTLAIIHLDLGERDTSRAYLDRQIRLSHALGDRTYEALGYHDLGVLQAAVDRQRGVATLEHARAMFHTSNDAENEALALYNIANIYQHAGDGEQAANYADLALHVLRAIDTQGMGLYLTIHIATLKAELAGARGQYNEAQTFLDQAYTLTSRYCPELLPHVQFCQGLHLVAIGNDADAVVQFQNAVAQLEFGQYELLADCHSALADCYERLGDYRAALGHHRAYAATRERTFIEVSEQKVRALDVIYQVETARRSAEAERQRNADLQHYIQDLEQRQAELRAISLRDPLTSLYNRRYLDEEGERLLRYVRRYGTTFCAAMVDVDNFKDINDGLGHQVGDLVLQQLAEIVSKTMRSTDVITRYGGEEIAILLPSTSIDAAYNVCERLRAVVEQHDWANIHSGLQVTISIGIAVDDGSTLADLLARADVQLYAAKRAGRNRTSYVQNVE